MNDIDDDNDSSASKPASVIQEADSAAAPLDPNENATRGKPPGQDEAGVQKPGHGGVLSGDDEKDKYDADLEPGGGTSKSA